MRISDWSSDVCSSDLQRHVIIGGAAASRLAAGGPALGQARLDPVGAGGAGIEPAAQLSGAFRSEVAEDQAAHQAGHGGGAGGVALVALRILVERRLIAVEPRHHVILGADEAGDRKSTRLNSS